MNRCDYCSRILVVLAVLAPLTILSCTPKVSLDRDEIQPAPAENDSAESPGRPPPLVVDSDAPLLLEEPTQRQQDYANITTQAAVENADCFVCHANYKSEVLAGDHAKANIGCADCHGQSLAHKNDENNTTPPEKMYPTDKIDPFCQGCHASHDVPADKVVALWTKRNLDKIDPDIIVCTDCHGEHRMEVRTVIWDKETGKLLRTNQGE